MGPKSVYYIVTCNLWEEKQGLVVEAIVTGGAGSPETAYCPDTGTEEEWLWAKRQAVAGALQRHQYQELSRRGLHNGVIPIAMIRKQ